MFDSYGREIRYLRISVTDRCNLRCRYCMPEEGVPELPHAAIMSYEAITDLARAAAGLGFDKVRITGGEPLVRKGIVGLVGMLAAIPGFRTVAMTTNGTLLAPVAADLAGAGLGSVNVSLDTLDPGRYRFLTRGGDVAAAMRGVEAARQAGLPVKLNVVVDPEGDQSDYAEVAAWAAKVGADVQAIRQYRLDEEKRDDDRYPRPPPCGSCDRIRLLADGRLRPCLHGDASVPVDPADPEGSIRRCVALKPPCGHHTERHGVSAIGG